MKNSWNDNGTYSVQVDGDWTICTVTDLLQKVAQQSHRISEQALRFAESNPEGRITTEIDLNNITTIDDSGYRILSLWLGHLKQQGFRPVIKHDNAGFCQRIIEHPYPR
jgi:hypothetical protein